MPRSALRSSWKLTGVFRIVADCATPFRNTARMSPLALRNWRYLPHVSCTPILTVCVPVTYDSAAMAAKRSGYMPWLVAPAFHCVPRPLSLLLITVYQSGLNGSFARPGW